MQGKEAREEGTEGRKRWRKARGGTAEAGRRPICTSNPEIGRGHGDNRDEVNHPSPNPPLIEKWLC